MEKQMDHKYQYRTICGVIFKETKYTQQKWYKKLPVNFVHLFIYCKL